ncbi:hypothetical protein L249_1778 [Ophiocordyceps polyrhachis-furcata BCC 54312]|uniref:CCD97-like C-terminal domain-containing protein n=1 Tax=Ophiocordyceps polyrhachis-furcata BCC 54312 TaxID=1330021 RepID=A0A367LQZ1_9HYPO|nr:hypothetical protein L249_1778 [Ophiocordyceps polyrhachis-furcata BCC 54312]
MDPVLMDMDPVQMDARLTGPAFEKPVPPPPKTAQQKASIDVQNRRREYLERNPSYLEDPEHELADAHLYDRLITSFQTEKERLDSDIAKGYDHVLQAHAARTASPPPTTSEKNTVVLVGAEDPRTVEVVNKSHGQQLWRHFVRERFLRGDDDEFDYHTVDQDEDLDVEASKSAEEAWFDDEEPAWTDDNADNEQKGETGIQDF